MKILQIGAGGIGSFLVKEVVECVEQGQIDSMIDYTIVDDDLVEINQITYQNFTAKEAGKNKADALAKRLKVSDIDWINSSKKRIETDKQLKGYDVFILCVDNDIVRKLVVEYCFKYNKEFIDLRAQGRNVFAMPKADEQKDNRVFISNDLHLYSCQVKMDLEKGYVQKGHKVAAMIGIQMLLNLLRGHRNKTINMVI